MSYINKSILMCHSPPLKQSLSLLPGTTAFLYNAFPGLFLPRTIRVWNELRPRYFLNAKTCSSSNMSERIPLQWSRATIANNHEQSWKSNPYAHLLSKAIKKLLISDFVHQNAWNSDLHKNIFSKIIIKKTNVCKHLHKIFSQH